MGKIRFSGWMTWAAVFVLDAAGEDLPASAAGTVHRTLPPIVAPAPSPSPPASGLRDTSANLHLAGSTTSNIPVPGAFAPSAVDSASTLSALPTSADGLPTSAGLLSGDGPHRDSLDLLRAEIAGFRAYLARSLRVSPEARHCPVPLEIDGKPVSKPWTLAHEQAASRELSPAAHQHFRAAARHNIIGTGAFFAGAVLSTVGPALASRPGMKHPVVTLLFPAGLLLEAAGFIELYRGNRLRTWGYLQYDRDLRARYAIEEPGSVSSPPPR